MFSWSFSHSLITSASPEVIWDLWASPSTWKTWDEGVEWVDLDGDFIQGQKGKLKPKKGKPVPFVLTVVERPWCFVDETRILGTKLVFSHRMQQLDEGRVEITHQADVAGPAAPLLKWTLGRLLEKGMPQSLKQLVELAERQAR